MKLSNLYILPDQVPRKQIAWFVPSLIASGASLLGSIGSSLFGSSSQAAANQANLQIARETNASNQQIAKSTNLMNRTINRENNEYNRNLAVEMFNLENAYNSPSRQMDRLRAAGINPFVAAGQVGQVEGRADTIPSQQPIPAQMIPNQMPAPMQPTFRDPGISANMANLAGALASIADAGQKGVNTDQAVKMFDDVMRKLSGEADLTENQALNERYQYTVNLFRGTKQVSKELRNLDAVWAKMQQDMNESEARVVRMDFQNALDDMQAKLHGSELERFFAVRPYLEKMAKQQYENLIKQGELLDSQSYSARASGDASLMNARSNAYTALKEGNYKDALTETENVMRGPKVRFENLQASKMYYDVQFLLRTLNDRVVQTSFMTAQVKENLRKTMSEILKLDKESSVIHASKIGAIYQDLKMIVRETLGDSVDLPF